MILSSQLRESISEYFKLILIAAVLAIALRSLVVEGRIVPSESMLPAIHIGDYIMVNKVVYHFEEPQRGDVVIFHPPDKLNLDDDLIKRLVALPGDQVEVKDGLLYVNGQSQQEPYLNDEMHYNFGPVVVPPDSYFVMGDNRNNSFDSHRWNAWLTRDHLIGKALCIYWPFSRIQAF